MRIWFYRLRSALILVTALGMCAPRVTFAGPFRDAVGGAMSAASRGGKVLSSMGSSGTMQRLKGSVSNAGRAVLSNSGGVTSKARQVLGNSSTVQRFSQGLSQSGRVKQALGNANQQFSQQLSQKFNNARPALSSAFGNTRQAATTAFNKVVSTGGGVVDRNIARAMDVNRSVFSKFQQSVPVTMAALAGANGNPGIANAALQGQPLDSLSNLATAIKAKAGIQGAILPPGVTQRLQQSEVLQAIVNHPELSNQKTQLMNQLQARGVNVTKLKTDLNKFLDPNRPFTPGTPNEIIDVLANAGVIPPQAANLVPNLPVPNVPVPNPLPGNGVPGGPQVPGNPPIPEAPPIPGGPPVPGVPPVGGIPPMNPPQAERFPWEEIVASIPLYLALANAGGGGDGGGDGGGGGYAPATQVVYAEAPAEASMAPPAAAPVANVPANVDVLLEDVQLIAPATVVAGPAYAVTVRNQSSIPVGRFQIAILAGVNGALGESAPQTTAEIIEIAPGSATTVTLRLPRSAMQMVAGGQMTPFTHLFVAADATDGLLEGDETNNLAVLERAALERTGN